MNKPDWEATFPGFLDTNHDRGTVTTRPLTRAPDPGPDTALPAAPSVYFQSTWTTVLRPDDIQSRGKSIGIRLAPGWWIRVHCFLHGHVLPMRIDEYRVYQQRWVGAEPDLTPPFIPLALVGDHGWVIVVVDRNRLTKCSFVESTTPSLAIWFDPQQGPCPITETAAFRPPLRVQAP